MLATLDRPTVADSPCVVKPWRLITEQGIQSGPVKGSDTRSLTQFPQSELRYGLPENWELKLFPPNYNIATLRGPGDNRVMGFGDTAFGVKHQFGTLSGFTFAADTKITIPTGRTAFSDGGIEANVQGIIGYNITPKLGISGMVGVSTLTRRGDDGRITRFASINPDVVVTYQINDSLQIYSELYGNTVTAPHQGPNLSYQGGVQYLLTKSIEVDLSGGGVLRGPAGLPSRYINAGLGLLF